MKTFVVALAVADARVGPARRHLNRTRQLKFFGDDTGLATWQKRPSARLAARSQRRRLGVHVLSQDRQRLCQRLCELRGHQGQASRAGKEPVVRLPEYNRQSCGSHRRRAPLATRWTSMQDGDGDYDFSAFLAAFHCKAANRANAAWSRADFTGQTAPGCSILVNNVQYTSDGTQVCVESLLPTRNPGTKVMSWVDCLSRNGRGGNGIRRSAGLPRTRMFNRTARSTSAIKNCARNHLAEFILNPTGELTSATALPGSK